MGSRFESMMMVMMVMMVKKRRTKGGNDIEGEWERERESSS